MMELKVLRYEEKDNRKRVTLPRILTPELAEDVGWHIGDGSMNIYIKNGYKHYWIKIAGDPTEEKLFYNNVIVPTKKRLYNISLNAKNIGDGSYGLVIYSKILLLFYNRIIGIPLSPKNNITIPDIIKKADESVIKACIRGVFDTDGMLTFGKKRKIINHYPSIEIESMSKNLIVDLEMLLKSMKLNCYAQFNINRPTPHGYNRITHKLFVQGKKKLDKWMEIIGFRSLKHLTKYKIWKEFGFCPTHTNLEQRIKILEGKLNPHSFYKSKNLFYFYYGSER